MAKVLVIGAAVVDFVFALESLPRTATKFRTESAQVIGGGCAANASVAIARLGGTACLGARLGDDLLGDLIVAELVKEGVDTSLVQRGRNAQSAFSSVYVDAKGERQIVNFRGAGLATDPGWIVLGPETRAVLADTRWGAGAARALELAKERGIPGIVDAEAPMDQTVLDRASHVAFSRDGLVSFAGIGELAHALLEADRRLPGWVCVTDGAKGTYYVDRGAVEHVPAFAVSVRDTLGAGDIWHGAFALALGEGRNEAQAIGFANGAAALKCRVFGGRKGSPTRAALDQFLKETP